MFTDEHDARVQTELRKGERLVWFGRPVPRAFARAARPVFWFGLFFTAFSLFWIASASAILCFGEGMQNAKGPEGIFQFLPLFGVPFFLIGVGMLGSPIWVRRWAKRSCYAITDRRVILWKAGWLGTVEVRSYSAEHLGRIVRTEYGDGTGDLIFEEIVERYTDTEGAACTRTIRRGFIGIEDVREVESLIRQSLALEM